MNAKRMMARLLAWTAVAGSLFLSIEADAQSSRSTLPALGPSQGYMIPSVTPYEPATANLIQGVRYTYGCGGMVLNPANDAAMLDQGFIRRTSVGQPGYVPCPSPLHNIMRVGSGQMPVPLPVAGALRPTGGVPVSAFAAGVPSFVSEGAVGGLPAGAPVSRSFIAGSGLVGPATYQTGGAPLPAPFASGLLRPVSQSGRLPAPAAPGLAVSSFGQPAPVAVASPLAAPPQDTPFSRVY